MRSEGDVFNMKGENIAVQSLNDSLNKAIQSSGAEDADAFKFERPRDSGHGDRASSAALKLARFLKSSPRDIAAKITANLESEFINKIEVAGAGFVNIFLSNNFIRRSFKTY